jgi:predicted small metal-binding protein
MRQGKEVTPVARIMRRYGGYVVREESDDELVVNVQEHAREVHDMDIISEQVLTMAQHEYSHTSFVDLIG